MSSKLSSEYGGPTTREEALALLAIGQNHERYVAAKALVRYGLPNDLQTLLIARRKETDAYAAKWLEFAIASCNKKATIEATKSMSLAGNVVEADARDRLRTQAVEWVASALLHEIGSKIGLLVAAATKEFPNYPGSDTQRHVQNIDKIFEGIAELRKATSVAHAEEFDLAQLIDEITAVESDGTNVDISLVGRRPLAVIADPNLLRLALCNGIRNAIEAVKTIDAAEDHRIVINWEVTDRDYWVSVIDHGPGVIGPIDPVFEIGRTNKAGHAGFGLAIAKQAMEMLGGTVHLTSSVAGGATYEVRGELAK